MGRSSGLGEFWNLELAKKGAGTLSRPNANAPAVAFDRLVGGVTGGLVCALLRAKLNSGFAVDEGGAEATSSSEDRLMLKTPSLGERRCLRPPFLCCWGLGVGYMNGKPAEPLGPLGLAACLRSGVAGGVCGGGVSASERSPASVISSQTGKRSDECAFFERGRTVERVGAEVERCCWGGWWGLGAAMSVKGSNWLWEGG